MTTSGEGLLADDLPGDDLPGDDEISDDAAPAPVTSAWRHPSRRRWVLFAAIALGVVVLDQLSKSWITTTLVPGESMDILGSWLRFVHWTNSGILFGMLPQSGPAFAVGRRLGPVEQVDLYNLMCRALGVEASPNDGQWARVSEALRD